jgi:predicted enzyme related to lactoylglutathione lyase
LIGLFLVGVFFYVESGLRRLDRARDVFEPYLRAGTRITLIVFAFPIGLSITLVVLEPVWSRVLFALLSLMILVANVDTAVRIRGAAKAARSTALLINEVVTSVVTQVFVVLPWALGGLHPTREDLTWAILLSFVAGFLSIGAVVMSAFDIARFEAAGRLGQTAGNGGFDDVQWRGHRSRKGGDPRGGGMNLNGILIGSEVPQRLTDYYSTLFGKPGWEGDGFTGWQIGSGWMTVGPHDQVKGKNTHPGRLIWNIETPDVRGEFERLRAAGAAVVREPYQPGETPDAWIATLSDPDDNYFQLVSPM